MNDYEIKTFTFLDSIYPPLLREIHNPPQKLFAIGDLSLLERPCVAIVGTRRSSPYGRWAAAEISKRIAKSGICIVSGMAEGIDSAAHNGALSCDGKTIAVLGTGIDICFPKSNAELYKKICKTGLVISEYAPGTRGYAGNFPMRNRIISGLSEKVIVVEGAHKSGSMITANLAMEQGRDVYSVPGNINQPNSTGTNQLISDGAIPILSIDDCLATMGISQKFNISNLSTSNIPPKHIDEFSSEERQAYELIRLSPGIQVEKLSEKINIEYVICLRLVSAMELKGLLRKEGQRLFVTF